MRAKTSLTLFLIGQYKNPSLSLRLVFYWMTGFFCSWSFPHRHSVAMANSYAQSPGMPLTTVTRTGKLDWTMVCVSRECMQLDQHTYSHGSSVTCLKTTVQHKFWALHLPLFAELHNFLAESSLESVVWALNFYKARTQGLGKLNNFVSCRHRWDYNSSPSSLSYCPLIVYHSLRQNWENLQTN